MAATADAELARYRAKRDFGRTAEPEGATGEESPWLFVVQKHAARRLHYDFRLRLGDTLKSWAVTRGPSVDPADKRLAVHVEDHPLDYARFEGTIPKGEYGGGTVMVWDIGLWRPLEDPEKTYPKGRLKFELKGKRMKGLWTLVRMGGRARDERTDNWLLIKDKDRHARPGEGEALIERYERSVLSRRTMEGIARANDAVWTKEGLVRPDGEAPSERAAKPRKATAQAATPGEDPLPDFVPPQLAKRVDRPPTGPGWVHEIKIDGYRLICRKEGEEVRLFTRNALDWTGRFPTIARAVAALPGEHLMLDGEVTVLGADGRTSFGSLQAHLEEGQKAELTLFLFDLLHEEGHDLRPLPLLERKARLEERLEGVPDPIRYLDHLDAGGEDVWRSACQMRLEGILSKKSDRPYASGRDGYWLKSKCAERDELIVIGFTTGKSGVLGALLLATREDGKLVYAGKCGSGFTAASAAELRSRLDALATGRPPELARAVPAAERREAHWVRPELVAEIEFTQWTRDGRLRHPVFQGLREDKAAAEVARERVEQVGTAETSTGSKTGTRRGKVVVAGLTLSNPERVLWPQQGVTKRDLAEYYVGMAEPLLRHAADRPLTLLRCPEGRQRACFFQKNAHGGWPDSLPVIAGEEGAPFTVHSAEGLAALAQMGALELHVWGSRKDRIEQPDRIVFDFDPDVGLGWPHVVAAAREARERLQAMGLVAFIKTTGGKGLHVVVPIARKAEWPEVRDFAKAFATSMTRDAPDRFTANLSKARRKGRIFVDYLRNQRGATAIAPYAVRARDGAPVATPIEWDELDDSLDPKSFNLRTAPDRLASRGDPWVEIGKVRQSLTAKAKRAVGLP